MEALEEAKDVTKLSLKPTDVIVFRVPREMHTKDLTNVIRKILDEANINNKAIMLTKDIEIFVISQEEAVLECL